MDEQLRQRLNRKLQETNLPKKVVSDEVVSDEVISDEVVDIVSNDDYIFLQEEPRFSTLEAIISDPSKLALVLLFGVSIYALYVLNKKS